MLQDQWHMKWPPPPAGSTLPLPAPFLRGVGALTTLGGSLCPGRYLTFSCCVLMISCQLSALMSSSNTHMVTCGSKCASWAALPPTILAMAEPWRERENTKVE